MKKVGKELLLVLLITALATIPASTFALPSTDPELVTPTYVMMQGLVTTYGSEPTAYGWCTTRALIGEWAKVNVFWIPATPLPPQGEPSTENFTYSFYMARLDNGTAELNYDIYDLYISGLWDVYNVTFGYYGELRNSSITPLEQDVPGELFVTGNWTDLTIQIEGFDLLTGIVVFHVERPMPIPPGDVSGDPSEGMLGVPDCKIDIWDLVHTAKAYDSTPGIMNYDFSLDFNLDFKIDIYDLTTIAVNIGLKY